ncbi:MAG: hypothetical protein V3S04_00400 [Candidatus Omnitrophota bacterium]
MPRERITRRQKNMSRLLREKRQSHKSRLDAGKKHGAPRFHSRDAFFFGVLTWGGTPHHPE